MADDLSENKHKEEKERLLKLLAQLTPGKSEKENQKHIEVIKRIPATKTATSDDNFPKIENLTVADPFERGKLLATLPIAPGKRQEILNQDFILITITDRENDRRVSHQCPKTAFLLKTDAFKERSFASGSIQLEKNNVFNTWFCEWLVGDPPLIVEPKTVFPLLKIADELCAQDLIGKCLRSWKNNYSEIDCEKTWWTSLRKETFLDFAKLFTNQELGETSNQPDLQSTLYEKFVILLNEPLPNKQLGHYATTANLFECKHCSQLLTSEVRRLVSCRVIQVDAAGSFVPSHQRAADWSLSGMLVRLRGNLWSWKMVYWRLWGSCHYVSCSACSELFPLSQMNWCRYHPVLQPNSPSSQSIHECCQQKIQHFQHFPPTSGCRYRPHKPITDTPTALAIVKIYNQHQTLIDMAPHYEIQKPVQMTQRATTDRSLIDKNLFMSAKKRKGIKGKLWSSVLTVGWNQDNQREMEEKLNKDIEEFLTRRSCRETDNVSPRPVGGLYVSAYGDWLESLTVDESGEDDDVK